MVVGLSEEPAPPPAACYSISFNNRGRYRPAICISLRRHTTTFIIGSLWADSPARRIIIRGIGGVSDLVSIPPVSLRFTRVTREKGGKSGGSGGGKGFGWKVSLQFNFYDAPCHFYPSFCNQPLSLSLFSFIPLSLSLYPLVLPITPGHLTLCSFERITIVEFFESGSYLIIYSSLENFHCCQKMYLAIG